MSSAFKQTLAIMCSSDQPGELAARDPCIVSYSPAGNSAPHQSPSSHSTGMDRSACQCMARYIGGNGIKYKAAGYSIEESLFIFA